MKRGAALENLTGAIVEICRSGLPPEELRRRVLLRLRRAVPFEAAFWTMVDPTTLLFTQPHQENIPHETLPYFIQNEFLDEDVNKWTMLARERRGVRTLIEGTAGNMDASPRYRDVFRPLGLGDELRAVLRIGDVCWGCMCLHRGTGVPFSRQEVRYVRQLAPHLAEGIRAGLLVASVDLRDAPDTPGLVVVAPDGSVASMTEAGARWLDELAHPAAGQRGLPTEVRALAGCLMGSQAAEDGCPRLTLRTKTGRWAVLHASRLPSAGTQTVAVIIDEPSPSELAPMLMMAYGLTNKEQAVTQLVCRGLSTRQLATQLQISSNTLQDHLKSIFDKTGVSSRGELVAAIFQQQYLPRAMAGDRVGASGFFTRSGVQAKDDHIRDS